MKQIMFILCLIFTTLGIQAQEARETVTLQKIGTVKAELRYISSDGDTTYYINLSFQNALYPTAPDRGVISFYSKDTLDEAIENLKKAIQMADDGVDATMGCFAVVEVHKKVVIQDLDQQDKYNNLGIAQAQNLLKFLEEHKSKLA